MRMQRFEININNMTTTAVILIAASFLIYAMSEYRNVPLELSVSHLDRSDIISGSDYFAGDQLNHSGWLLVNFWASWCAPCREEMPLLETLHREHPWGDNFSIVTLAQDQDASPLKAYWNRYGFTMDGRIDLDQTISASLSIEAYPTTILISPDNQIIKVWPGAEPWADFEMADQLSQLMNTTKEDSL